MNSFDDNERFYRDTENIAFPNLTDHQLAQLEQLGDRRAVRCGEVIFPPASRDFPLVLVVSGELEVYDPRDGNELILAYPGPRSFVGEVSMLNGTSSLAGVRGKAVESVVVVIPAREFRQALSALPGVGERVVQAFIMRRKRLQRDSDFLGLRIVAHEECNIGHRIDDFLDKNHIPHHLFGLTSKEGRALCDRLGVDEDDLPILVASDGTVHKNPNISEVARVAGLLRPLAEEGQSEICCDLAIVGAGPAGLAAAVNAASEGLRTVVLESFAPGGQAKSSSLIENFFGFPTGISGGDLTNRAQLQAHRFGAKFSTPSQALTLAPGGGEHAAEIHIEGCETLLRAKTVILSTGAEYNRIDAGGRADFEGLGVYYAATAMESQFCHGATVIVAGAGNSAGQAAMFLSEHANRVILAVRGADLVRSMSSYLSNRVEATGNIEIRYHTEIRSMSGEYRLESVELENKLTGSRETVEVPAIFSMIGARPCTSWLPPEVMLDDRGFIKTGAAVADAPAWRSAGRSPLPFETSLPGIFAAGDVRSGSVKRCSAAVGEGSMAVENVHQMLGTYS